MDRRGKRGPRAGPFNSSFSNRSSAVVGTPGLHSSGLLSERELVDKLKLATDHSSRLLPLPLLEPPAAEAFSSSPRVRRRRRDRWALYRIASATASACGYLYAPSSLAAPRPVRLIDMPPIHRQAWLSFLEEAKKLRVARRLYSTMTGEQALEELIKRPLSSYATCARSTRYVPLIASELAEPRQPELTVPMLEALSPDLSEWYADERNLLRGGGSDLSEIATLNTLGNKVGGSLVEYVKYFQRPDVQLLWDWCADGDERATCSSKAVMKSNGKQRNILAVLHANYVMNRPLRNQPLGLLGGASLTSLIIPEDTTHVATFDQENCFAYIEVPSWMRKYQAAPRVLHSAVGGPSITGLWSVPLNKYVRPLS